MDLKPEDLAREELGLYWIHIIRAFFMMAIPLFLALLIHSFYIKPIFWLLFLIISFSLVGPWGHTMISTQIILLLLYIYFEIKNAPHWLAYVIGFIIVLNISFISKRIKDIRKLNEQLYPIN
jgi:hypothetical protein